MIIAVVGPSAVGKTKLSIMLAKKYNAIIINADATQIYKELNIGSAKINESEKEGIQHFLLDIKDLNEDYSVMNYQKDARQVIENNKNRNIIVVGGTGLYLKALFYDYVFEERTRETYDNYSNEELYKMALAIDNKMDIHINNRIRLINFIDNKGKIRKDDQLLFPNVIFIGLTMDRKQLYERINKRVDEMIENGLIDEAAYLFSKCPDSKILNRAIGYKELKQYLNKKCSKEETIELIKKNSRHYVKRQYTWFNNQMNINWFDVDVNNFDMTFNKVIQFIDSLNSK